MGYFSADIVIYYKRYKVCLKIFPFEKYVVK